MFRTGFNCVPLLLVFLLHSCLAVQFEPSLLDYNLNQNRTATLPRDYGGQWQNHSYQPSPQSWRMPFYALTIDRFIDGDPTNNEANGTVFEHFWLSNQFRFGGDVAGVRGDLDYLQGLGIKVIYFTGSMMINMPWSADGYGPLDFTLLDGHHGTIAEWRALVDDIHSRGMYLVFDNTISTMGNLLGYEGKQMNTSTPFSFYEWDMFWKVPERRYRDFNDISNTRDDACELPRIWELDGYLEPQNITDKYHGCMNSEFDQYGDLASTGSFPSYVNQFARFASVQDRLREWRPDVLEKINVMSCLQIAMLDIDGFRVDKAVQVTVDALAAWSDYQRQCAKMFGKENFLIVGEVVASPELASIYFGRGKQPDQALLDPSLGVHTDQDSNGSSFIRPFGTGALDGASFHYDIYGAMTRFLGLDGPWGAHGVDWVQMWNEQLMKSDLVNSNTGVFDPRHIYGMTNQDVFRWPALQDGIQRQCLGFFVVILELPGIPMILFGEEQEFYVWENLASDYVYGRTPMASSTAAQLHSCYHLGVDSYVNVPLGRVVDGCHDDAVSLDHRDPSHPVRNIIKRMFELRDHYPVLNDGYNLTTLSTRLYNVYLPGSQHIPSPHGIWSVYRGRNAAVQDLTGTGHGNVPLWLLFHNENYTMTYSFNCSSTSNTSPDGALVAAFPKNTTVKNLFYPYDVWVLEGSNFEATFESNDSIGGCLPEITLRPWEYKLFVPIDEWQQPKPVMTSISPGHDQRILATASSNYTQTVPITIGFSRPMDCESIANSLQIESTTLLQKTPILDPTSIVCESKYHVREGLIGEAPDAFIFQAQLVNVAHGIHTLTIVNATTNDGTSSTQTRDRSMFRIGLADNPMVFMKSANYTADLLHQEPDSGSLYVSTSAAGADQMRYSTNWGTSWSEWQTYTGENVTLQQQAWSGTKLQQWKGQHVVLQYWSRLAGSTDYVQHSDLHRTDEPPRRWPHAWLQGDWNQWGYDAGIPNALSQTSDGAWKFNLFTEWPTNISINVWGMNPDGQKDITALYGDVDTDGVLDWSPPDSLANNIIQIRDSPPHGRLGWQLLVNDGTYGYTLTPYGSSIIQIMVLTLITIVPIITALIGVMIFMGAFYKVRFNKAGSLLRGFYSWTIPKLRVTISVAVTKAPRVEEVDAAASTDLSNMPLSSAAAMIAAVSPARRKILIATMEYEIQDWSIKVKIGGLGVMASLMGNNLSHQDIIWVVPCMGGISYPFEEGDSAPSMEVTIMDELYDIEVHYHTLRNITYVLLDAPIFRERTKADPYPPRMDDLDSSVYYSAWNQCIAQVIQRFTPDVYHINDYHGACAPLYLLPAVVPCCLSLHNAEFQGMWPLSSTKEMKAICGVFNLSEGIVRQYVQFGSVFNLLHAGVRYLYIHQEGFGAVGVSKKYGTRSRERYAIFWCLNRIDALPNPDPTDLAPTGDSQWPSRPKIDVDEEKQRKIDRCEAQEWAGLKVDPKAELFIFVGRWSQQKGIDLIADLFPAVLRDHPNTQLICVGPVIDLYGRFAALKLGKLMKQYPDRVFSKPEFTALPPCLFSGAEFALMPSRDEPFGLVAVEFGRKGALCVGSRVGGFGHMPGWWYTVEAVTSKHLISQFEMAVSAALASKYPTRATMRAWSKLQRFPVIQWVQDLEKLHVSSIEMSVKSQPRLNRLSRASSRFFKSRPVSSASTLRGSATPPRLHTSGSSTPSRSTHTKDTRLSTPVEGSSFLAIPEASPNSLTRSIKRPSTPSSLNLNPSTILDPPAAQSIPEGCSSPTESTISESHLQSRSPVRSEANTGELTRSRFIRTSSTLSLTAVASASSEAAFLQSPAPLFVDSKNVYYNRFSEELDKLASTKRPTTSRLIEDYLVESEKDWFGKFHQASLSTRVVPTAGDDPFEFSELLGENYEAPHGFQSLLQKKFGSWYIYSYLLALGQILCASSLQLTILEGALGQSAKTLYILCGIYGVSSFIWWVLYRRYKAVYVLCAPFYFFGVCFVLLGFTHFASNDLTRAWMFRVGSWIYTVGSSAGWLFFTLNFGTEGGTPVQTWALRACIINGTQQLLIAFFWLLVTLRSLHGQGGHGSFPSTTLLAITIPCALVMWVVATLLLLGLPSYYRQRPGGVPSFYKTLCKRNVVQWFWLMVILQGYWLACTTGRNWSFLWSSRHVPFWIISLLVIGFFVGVWSVSLLILARLTREHSWIIPIFAIGLGTPAWCQVLWGVSGIGCYIPWAGAFGGAILSRCIWLWLGVLHALQDVGFGMILLMSLTRLHVAFVFVMAQVIGSAITILARATSPSKLGGGDVFINFAGESIAKPWLWISLLCQLIVCIGYFKVFRKSQLLKP